LVEEANGAEIAVVALRFSEFDQANILLLESTETAAVTCATREISRASKDQAVRSGRI
jgi:hypothetical protein